MKRVFNLIRKIILSAIIIYAYDSIALPMNIIIPINAVTVLLVSLFGIPAMFGLILFSFIF